MKVIVAQSCLTLCNPVDCSLPGFSLQARILEGVDMPSSRDLCKTGIQTGSFTLQEDSLPSESPGTILHNHNIFILNTELTI